MDLFIAFLRSYGEFVLYAAIFVSVCLVVLAFGNITASWADIRRRATASGLDAGKDASQYQNLTTNTAQYDFLKGLIPTNEERKTELVRFLNSAGYYGTGAVIIFQLLRLVCGALMGLGTAFLFGRLYPDQPFGVGAAVAVALTFFGYMLPRSIVSMQRDGLLEEHRNGFPDFLDLLVICVEAGIGIDSAVDRVSKDMVKSTPSLARNLAFMSLELRAGKSTREALDNLAIRLGIPEARSFATLIQQSEELGTSLVQTLRIYSDEMREKRLSRAEEKAHSLPVKLVLPLALFIFPVILGVTLMPVAMKLFKMLGI